MLIVPSHDHIRDASKIAVYPVARNEYVKATTTHFLLRTKCPNRVSKLTQLFRKTYTHINISFAKHANAYNSMLIQKVDK